MKKKVVFLPYDFDTAIGINNEGSLVFSYNLEDIDQTQGGADVFNGQQSVLWKNLRAAFASALAAMYRTLRSTGALSYEKVERMFEEHQDKWGEAIFNEDAYFKYLAPLIEDGDGAYLSMLQGSKAEQRKWWLYNRFKYLDSKYNAGDALSDVIQLRGYAKSNVTITPYADVYASVKFGSYLMQTRAARNQAYTIVCPLDSVNDTEIYIYSASQLSSVGDLSGLKVGFADFSLATKLQSIKVGDNDAGYSNGNLEELHLGNNVLLRTLDVRNCVRLGTGDQKTVDVSGCKNLEYVYFDGTAVTAVALPVGGILKTLHLPATITNLTIRNQLSISDLTVPSYANVSTLWLENASVDSKTILSYIPANARVRITGFTWEVADAVAIDAIYDILDTMRGLDEYGNNMETAQVAGTIHLSAITGEDLAALQPRYPYITINADHVQSSLIYKTWDGSETLKTVTCIDGVPEDTAPAGPVRTATERNRYTFVGWNTTQDASTATVGYDEGVLANRTVYAAYSRVALTYLRYSSNDGYTIYKTVTCVDGVPEEGAPAAPGKASTAQYNYTFVGWNVEADASSATVGYDQGVTTDRVVYPAYTESLRTYTVTWKNSDNTVLETDTDVPYGTTPTYDGATPQNPVSGGGAFLGWLPAVDTVSGDAVYTANYTPTYTVRFYNGSTLLQTVIGVAQGGTATYTGATPVDPVNNYPFDGWSPQPTNIQADTDCYAQFHQPAAGEITDNWETIIQNITNGTANYSVGQYKPLDLGTEGIVNMEIVARGANASPLAAGGGNASYDFVAKELLTTKHAMNSNGTNTGGWENSDMRSYLKNTIKPLIPQAVRNAIKEVTKTSYRYDTSAKNATTTDDVWIPSYREIFGGTDYESDGPVYGDIYTDNASRVKNVVGASSASHWWLRSAYSSDSYGFRFVNTSGGSNDNFANSSYGVALGFSL